MGILYAWEKLHKAVDTLCGEGSHDDRLVDAITSSLIHIDQARDFDGHPVLQDQYSQLISTVSSETPIGNEGSVRATIRKMEMIQRRQVVDSIMSIYDEVARLNP